MLECDLMFGEGKEVGEGDMVELNLTGQIVSILLFFFTVPTIFIT